MIITCEKCSTSYRLTPQQLKPFGKRVKCTNCGNIWFQKYEEQQEEILSLDPIPTHSSLPVVVEHHTPVWLKFMPVMFFCMIIVSVVFFHQNDIIKIFPKANQFYDIIGIPHTGDMRLDEISINHRENYADINGLVINKSKQTRIVPKVIITVSDSDGSTTLSNIINIPKSKLEPNESRPFHKRVINIPKNSQYLTVSIADKFDLFS